MRIFYALLLFCGCHAFAQNFEKEWTKVVSLEDLGLIKSANEKVAKIYAKAKRNGNDAQSIKCFFYQSKYLLALDPRGQSKTLERLRAEAKNAVDAKKAIYDILYAKCLAMFLERNSYRVNRILETDRSLPDEVLLWSRKEFGSEIERAYAESMQDANLLRKTRLSQFDPIFDYIFPEKFAKQTLFDYVISENIAYRKMSISDYPRDFLTSETKRILMGSASDFCNANFDSVRKPDQKRLLKLLQSREKSQPDFDNRRLRVAWIFNRSSYLIQALEKLRKDATDTTDINNTRYALAEKLRVMGTKASPKPVIRALSLLDSILRTDDRSNAFRAATDLRNAILSKSLNVQLKKELYEGEHSRAFASFRNIDSIKISYYKVRADFQLWDRYSRRKALSDTLSRLKPFLTKRVPVRNPGDHFEHTTEIPLPEMPLGTYIVMFSVSGNEAKNTLGDSQIVTVTNLACVNYNAEKSRTLWFVNRKSGKPEKAKTTIKFEKSEIVRNDTPFVSIPKTQANYGRYRGWIVKGVDTLAVSEYAYYSGEQSKMPTATVTFYLDRAIYRPSQTVYFKGILLQRDSIRSHAMPQVDLIVTASDANGKKFFETTVSTNEFGSFSGEFALPKDVLTGDFTLEADIPDQKLPSLVAAHSAIWDEVDFSKGYISFKVEEYKRPTFELAFDPVTEKATIGQIATLSGKATSLSGSAVSEAKVAYVVKLQDIDYGDGSSSSQRETIAQDTITTDQNGRFAIKFPTTPIEDEDEDDRRNLPIYKYLVEATVIDISGETHSATTGILVGYHTLALGFTASVLKNTKGNIIEVSAKDLNGQHKPTKGKLEFSKIRKATKNFRDRAFEEPEIDGFTTLEFARLFPNEIDPRLLNVGKDTLVLKTINVDTARKRVIDADLSDFEPGVYKLSFSAKDEMGNTIHHVREMTVTDAYAKIDLSQLFTMRQLNQNPKKDGFALVRVTSFVNDLNVRLIAKNAGNLFFESDVVLENGSKTVKIPIETASGFGFSVNADAYYDNAFKTSNIFVRLPVVESELSIETISYRNLIDPGSKQKWSFRVKAKNTERQSEILASMYDASLDVFAKSEWQSPTFRSWSYPYEYGRTSASNETLRLYISEKIKKNGGLSRPEQTQLLFFGLNFGGLSDANAKRLYKDQLARKVPKPKGAKLVYGNLTDEYGTLPNSTVRVKGTSRTAIADEEGYYEIEAAEEETLVYEFADYAEKEVSVGYGKNINVRLESRDDTLGEVVVTRGAGIRRKAAAMTSSYTIVTPSELNQESDSETVQKLLGKVAGLQVSTDTTGATRIVLRGNRTSGQIEPLVVVDGSTLSMAAFQAMNPSDIVSVEVLKSAQGTALYGAEGVNGVIVVVTKKTITALANVKARTNLSETAFFFPHLKTDEKGNATFSFTSPENLTSWKLRLIAHNKSGTAAQIQKKVTTQKNLMLTPNFPRFLRENDSISISVKIANMSAKALKGDILLEFRDAATMELVDEKLGNVQKVQPFGIASVGNTSIKWKIRVPEGLSGLHYRVVAQSGDFSDGEENIVPVLPNRILVTDSKPLWVREHSEKSVSLEKLGTLPPSAKPHKLTLEFTSNPAWLALESLPYLMEFEHECAEQTFARFYANAIATEVISSNPKITGLLDTWRKNGSAKLESNENLKSILVNETPWFNDALSDADRKKRLALLFDLDAMKASQKAVLAKLKNKQKESGAFGWFDGSPEDVYITRHIAAGLGHLKKLKSNVSEKPELDAIAKKAVAYIDKSYLASQDEKSDKRWLSYYAYEKLHYLYARSFYADEIPLDAILKKQIESDLNRISQNKLDLDLYQKGLAALVFSRFGRQREALALLANLSETSATDETNGTFWVENTAGWHWYRAPIETQALLIEAFSEIGGDKKTVDGMKAWLIKQKQNANWPTTKSTTEAVYALTMQGSEWLNVKDNVIFTVGNRKIATQKMAEAEKQAETGYIKIEWKPEDISSQMATLKVENKTDVPGFGGYYFQYFENLDEVKPASGEVLKIRQEFFRKQGAVPNAPLHKLEESDALKIGDLITVRMTIEATQDLEYVHLKSMRASCFEPVDVLSGYQSQANLWFYKSTKDVATHFFFSRMREGVYQLEYDVRVNNAGNFSNGITTIQSMYAPEFSAHSKGFRVKAK